MKWDKATEDLLENLVDEAQIRHRLHKRCYEHYSDRNTRWTLPVIILSVISGSGNFISQSFPTIEKEMIISIGGLSVLVSIISSISQYLGLARESEGNRIAMLSWGKFASMIRFEISLRKQDREECKDFIKQIINEFQRLQEISPNIPEPSIRQYRRELGALPDKFKVPLWFNGVQHIEAFNTPLNGNTPDDRSIELSVREEEQPPSILTELEEKLSL